MKNTAIVALAAAMLAAGGSHAHSYGHLQVHRSPFDVALGQLVDAHTSSWNSLFQQHRHRQLQQNRSDPRHSVTETDTHVQLELEVPGVLARDLTVDVNEVDDYVRIQGRRTHHSSFDVSFRLSPEVNSIEMQATLSSGILQLRVPKQKKEKGRSRSIEVVSGETTHEGAEELNIAETAHASESVDGMTITEDTED